MPAASPPWPAVNARVPSPVRAKKRTQPSSSVYGPTITPSRKADPGKLWPAKSKARRQTVAGQQGRGQEPRRDERRTSLRTPAGTPPWLAKGRRAPHLPTLATVSTVVLVNRRGSQRAESWRGQSKLRDLGTDPSQGNPFSVLSDPDNGSQEEGPAFIRTIPVWEPTLTGAQSPHQCRTVIVNQRPAQTVTEVAGQP